MVILNKVLTTHPLYFARFIPLAMLLCFTACGGKDDFANKPVTITPGEQAVASPNANEPPIIIRSPDTSNAKTYPAPKNHHKK